MKRFSVVYRLKEQYCHIPCSTYFKATILLRKAHSTPLGKPIGIYDAKTELFQWGPLHQQLYDTMSFAEQGRKGNEIISLVQVLRRQDDVLDEAELTPLGLY